MIDIQPLSPELQEAANRELFEVPSRIADDLHNLKLWISQQSHLKVRNCDQFLIQFLRGSKFSLEKAKERIDLYYTLISKYPDFFLVTDVHSPVMSEVYRLGCFTLLPKPLNDCGPRIAVYRYNYTVPQHKLTDITRGAETFLELAMLNDPYASIYGLVYIVDMAKFNINHLRQITPSLLKIYATFVTKTLPLRLKAAYFINFPPISIQLFKLLLPFLPEKIKQRIHMCGSDMKELTSHVPLRYLPQDFGGENGSLDELTIEWQKTISDNANYFKENEAYGVDESLRPGKPIDFDSIYGMEGSFRKLEVD